MGQVPSQKSPDAATPPAAIVQTRIQRHAMEIRQIVSMTYDEFLVKLEELNTMYVNRSIIFISRLSANYKYLLVCWYCSVLKAKFRQKV